VREVSDECSGYFAEFDKLGETTVRNELERHIGGFIGKKAECAKRWLRNQELDRVSRERTNAEAAVTASAAALRAASAAESANSIARSARRSARFANIIAMIAIISSVITTIFGDQIRSWIFQLIR
jgi:hypothetical protein